MRAVQFDSYGGIEVLEVREVPDPVAAPGRVVVRVRAAGINPGEIGIREGRLHERWPATFPSGQGTDLAGVVEQVGEGVSGFAPGDEVIGWSEERSSQAELVAVPSGQLIRKPENLSWEVAGSLFVAGMAAVACVEAVNPREGETVVVSAAAGGVGGIAAQLTRLRGATVIGLAGQANQEWLRAHGITALLYGDGQEQRIRDAAPGGVDAFIDTFGGGYVDLAVSLGVPVERINTIIDFEAAARLGVKTQGTHAIATPERLSDLARLVAAGKIDVEVAHTYPLDSVREAVTQLAQRHTRGKIVLIP